MAAIGISAVVIFSILVVYFILEELMKIRVFDAFITTQMDAIPDVYVEVELSAIKRLMEDPKVTRIVYKGFAITLNHPKFKGALELLCERYNYDYEKLEMSTNIVKGITYLGINQLPNGHSASDSKKDEVADKGLESTASI